MKNISFSILALLLIAGNANCQETIDIEKEKAAIIAVIEEETDAFLDRDFNRLASKYVQDETNIRVLAGNGYWMSVGWDEIGSYFKKSITNSPEPRKYKLVKSNYKIKVYDDSAWAVFDQVKDKDGEVSERCLNVRILEKVNGEWKIVYLSAILGSS